MSLTKTKRRIIFYLSVLIFLVITPAVILYSLGYYYNLKNQTLIKTGGIFLKSSNASGYRIFLNNNFAKEISFITSGALLGNLDEGEYAVEIKKDGFLMWSKTIKVQKEIVTEIRNILLLPDIAQNKTQSTHGTTTANFALLSISPDESKIIIRDQKDGALYLAESGGFGKNPLTSLFSKHNIIQIWWNNNSQKLIFKEASEIWHLMNLASLPKKDIIELPEKITYRQDNNEITLKAMSYAFDKSGFDKLFVLDESGRLSGMDFKNDQNSSTTALLENINSLGFGENKILALFKNGFFARTGLDGKNTEVLGRQGVYLSKEAAKIGESKNGDIYLIDASGGLFFMQNGGTEIQPFDGAVLGAEFDSEAKKLLYWKESELHILFIKDESYQPYRKAGTHIKIPAASEKINPSTSSGLTLSKVERVKKAAWYDDDNEHIMVLTQKGIFVSDIDDRGGFFVKKIIDGFAQNFIYSTQNQKLYWSDGRMVYEMAF
ncbi:MAG: hypothetical protein A3G49_04230 [Candidatus Sungbacteria bacterium RIFCSPLOWO2_12_FULL_41_11]|uniref:PEGA domain-containing protein n=1 Tax=Candidatus Sungbacteria bacterium RIFCSPLOWO2_12_FULL_41_11 TaxID=1802286 RepID=A0A1G2LT91_9BACT|nr:MAG: hypothetical protein A3D41_01365 [Candidatus Sungbacteria bacterium RIFCSPHIGHO2_02_FULL_41_12b]OHA14868.1 MAG: hypothetical protein A3G49_04230 [Candidatus Sungbacteria bacterium RIFCSPLOWO2_12_FULL_41_11]